MMPLLIEATLMALAGFSAGLLLAYLVALRRRRHY
jgi:LPXTG-motif cell wall-anchored protein